MGSFAGLVSSAKARTHFPSGFFQFSPVAAMPKRRRPDCCNMITQKEILVIAAFVAAIGHSCPLSCWSPLRANYVQSTANGPAAALMQDAFPRANVKIGVVE